MFIWIQIGAKWARDFVSHQGHAILVSSQPGLKYTTSEPGKRLPGFNGKLHGLSDDRCYADWSKASHQPGLGAGYHVENLLDVVPSPLYQKEDQWTYMGSSEELNIICKDVTSI